MMRRATARSQTVTEAVAPTVYSTTQPPAARPGTTTYQWDAQDRLLGVTLPDDSVHRYKYDYRTRRIGTETRPMSSSTTSKQTAIVFSGGLSVAEWESNTGSLPVSPTVEYTRGPDMGGGVGGLLYSLRGEDGLSSARYNLSNGRGDIVAQASQSAELKWTASYEAYGKRTKETGTNLDKQRGNSKDEDPTGLLNEGFRYRDLETAVWLSRDPAGFVDGPNVYAYVKENPWSAFDPYGLEYQPILTTGGMGSIEYAAKHAIDLAVNIGSKVAQAVSDVDAVRGNQREQQIFGTLSGPEKRTVEEQKQLNAAGDGAREIVNLLAGKGSGAKRLSQERSKTSKRNQYMGKTPNKDSTTGRAVIERMTQEGKIRT